MIMINYVKNVFFILVDKKKFIVISYMYYV